LNSGEVIVDTPFSDLSAAAWMFHRHSSRLTHNAPILEADETPERGKELPESPWTALPPARDLSVRLDEAVRRRGSCREFSDAAVPLADLADLLHRGYGLLDGVAAAAPALFLRRPVPSGGAMYGLELYVLAHRISGLAPGAYHFQPVGPGLEQVREGALPPALATRLFLDQAYAAEAAGVVVITAMFRRSLKKYRDRGYRYLLLEAGHVGQNLALAAVGLDLGACALGGFYDVELGQLLKLDLARELPLYALAFGRPDASEAGPD
jgi:SagB-type dehydrogenase family enzyme